MSTPTQAEITILVNLLGEEAARRHLQNLADTANRTTTSTNRLNDGITELGGSLGNLPGPLGDLANSMSGLAGSAQSLMSVGALGGMAALAVGAAVSLEALAINMALAADDAGELAAQLDISIERLEVMSSIADTNSGSVEGMSKVFDKLAKSMAKADEDNVKTNKSLADLGLSYAKLEGLAPEQQAVMIMEAYADLGKTQEGVAAVSVLLGQSWRSQSVAIKALAEDAGKTAEMMAEFGIRTEELQEKGGRAEDAMKRLGFATKGFSQTISEGFGDPFIAFANGAANAIKWVTTIYSKYEALKVLTGSITGAGIGAAVGGVIGGAGGALIGGVGAVPGAIAGAKAGAIVGTYLGGKSVVDAGKQRRQDVYLNSGNEDASFDNSGNKKKAAEAQQKLERNKLGKDSKADSAGKQAISNAERIAELGKQAIADAERQLLVTQKQSFEELARFDTTKGNKRELKEADKAQLIELAKQRDIQVDQIEKAKEQKQLEEEITKSIKDRVKELGKVGASASGRLAGIGDSLTSKASFERRSVGLSALDKEAMTLNDSAKSEATRGRKELESTLGGKNDTESLEKYKAELAKIDEAERSLTNTIGIEIENRKAMQSDWTVGAKNAFASYVDEANNLSAQMENVGKRVFQGMSDSLTTFVTTGKLTFKSFAASIISDLARIAAQKAIAGLAGSLLGSIGGMFGPGVIGAGFANGGAFSKGTQFFADGGVVNRATGFGMAGGGQGVMGEAGPEAIMPLKRGADGKLGVAMSGGSSNPAISQTNIITVQGSSDGNPENDKKLAQLISNTIDKKWQENYAKATRVGGVANRVSLAV